MLKQRRFKRLDVFNVVRPMGNVEPTSTETTSIQRCVPGG